MTSRSRPAPQLDRWLAARGIEVREISALAGDVSRRRYRRVTLDSGQTVIAVSYPDDMRAVCRRFRATATVLTAAQIRVPEILESDCDSGVMLVEDLGATTLYRPRAGSYPAEMVRRVAEAVEISEKIRRLPQESVTELSEPLDRLLLRRELDASWTLALAPAGLVGSQSFAPRLRAALTRLLEHLVEHPLEPCHRDFMVRNLMLSLKGELVLIDHQDLRLGPRFYDLASLLNDSFFPDRSEERRLRQPVVVSQDDLDQYRRCAVQRCLKAVGTFVSFAARGDRRHLELVAPMLERAAHHLSRLPEGQPLGNGLRQLWAGTSAQATERPIEDRW
jgi:aminoglycoside/choline kinase family phosphotransferase